MREEINKMLCKLLEEEFTINLGFLLTPEMFKPFYGGDCLFIDGFGGHGLHANGSLEVREAPEPDSFRKNKQRFHLVAIYITPIIEETFLDIIEGVLLGASKLYKQCHPREKEDNFYSDNTYKTIIYKENLVKSISPTDVKSIFKTSNIDLFSVNEIEKIKLNWIEKNGIWSCNQEVSHAE